MKPFFAATAAAALAACAASPAQADPQDAFFAALADHCGKAYAGRLVSDQQADAAMRDKAMIVHFRRCTPTGSKSPSISRGWRRTAAGTVRAPGLSPAPTPACG